MSLVVYNGVGLPYPYSTSFTQTSEADPSNTDFICTKFDITVQAVLNKNYMSYITNLEGGNDPATIMVFVRKKLMERRKPLSFKVNGVEMIPVIASQPGNVDSMNGPQPQHCEISLLTNESFLINYRVVANYWENQRDGEVNNRNVGSAVLWNRWNERVTYDNCMYATYNRTGKYFIRSDNAEGLTPDALRESMAVLAIPQDFLRIRATYNVAENGLAMEYEIEDKEVAKLPPTPAMEATGFYAETTQQGGSVRNAIVQVRLRGSKEAVRADLIKIAVAVCSAKLNIAGVQNIQVVNGTIRALLEQCMVKVGLYDNWVECTMQSLMQPRTTPDGKGRQDGVAGPDFNNMASTPGSDEGAAPQQVWLPRGTSPGLVLQAAAYWDPSLKATLDKATGQMTQGKQPGQTGVNP